MKKDKKENIQEASGPQKIEVDFKSGEMFFKVNGKESFLDKETVSLLFPREVLLRLKVAEEKEIENEFETIESLAKFRFFSGRGMNPRQIADALGFDEAKYIKWLSMNASLINKLISASRFIIDAKIEELEKKYPLPEPKKEEGFWPEPLGKIGRRVAEMLLEDKGPRIIAQELKVDYGKFYRWFLNKDIQRNVLRIRDELAEERRMKAERKTVRNK